MMDAALIFLLILGVCLSLAPVVVTWKMMPLISREKMERKMRVDEQFKVDVHNYCQTTYQKEFERLSDIQFWKVGRKFLKTEV